MKKLEKYESVKIELVLLDLADVIATSPVEGPLGGDGESKDWDFEGWT